MRKTREVQWRGQVFLGILSFLTAILIALAADWAAIVSHAESQGKALQNARIRVNADINSEAIGSTKKDGTVSIKSQTTGADGSVWYQVFVDSDTLGFIRSDMVEITDGTTPPKLAEVTTTPTPAANTPAPAANTPAPVVNETPAEVTAVNPISATVKGGQSVRVRENASTTSRIVDKVQNGLALTVTGYAAGTDNNQWYQVNFTVDGSEVTGFIRSDYVELSGELTAPSEAPPVDPVAEPAQPQSSPETQESKRWETQLQGDKWYLIDNETADGTAGQYEIQKIFDAVDTNGKLYDESLKTVKILKAVIIGLVFIAIALVAAVTLLFFRMRDMADAAYFEEAERQNVRRRSADRPQGTGQRAARPAGSGRPENQRRPQTARPAQGGQGQRPVQGGQRPAQGVQGQRSVQNGQGQRPVQNGQGQRPIQNSQSGQGQRPAQNGQGQRLSQNGQSGQGQRPIQNSQSRQDQRQAQGGQGQRRVQGNPQPEKQQGNAGQNPAWKSRNFMAEDDEFEFEFLNWDGEEEQ